MCLGIPMKVVAVEGGLVWCEDAAGQRVRIDTLLVGPVEPGSWLLTWLGMARECIDAGRAARISAALQALEKIARGETDIDACFADLVGREPQLPDFLRKDLPA